MVSRIESYITDCEHIFRNKTKCFFDTAKGKLKGDYHFRTVYIWDEDNCRMLRRMLVIRRNVGKKGDYDYKCLNGIVKDKEILMPLLISKF